MNWSCRTEYVLETKTDDNSSMVDGNPPMHDEATYLTHTSNPAEMPVVPGPEQRNFRLYKGPVGCESRPNSTDMERNAVHPHGHVQVCCLGFTTDIFKD